MDMKKIPPMPSLYIEGHNVRKGFAVSRCWSDFDCSRMPPASEEEMQPVRFYSDGRYAKRVVERFNRMQERRCAAIGKTE
jgi:hypothetical protein